MADDEKKDPERIDLGEGAILRPPMEVLGEESLISPTHEIRPAPNRFTHELVVDEPYRFDPSASEPTGVLPAGTSVLLVVEGDRHCWVVDGAGRYVEVRTTSLRQLPGAGTGA